MRTGGKKLEDNAMPTSSAGSPAYKCFCRRQKPCRRADSFCPRMMKSGGPREIVDFVGPGIEALKLVLPEEKGADRW